MKLTLETLTPKLVIEAYEATKMRPKRGQVEGNRCCVLSMIARLYGRPNPLASIESINRESLMHGFDGEDCFLADDPDWHAKGQEIAQAVFAKWPEGK